MSLRAMAWYQVPGQVRQRHAPSGNGQVPGTRTTGGGLSRAARGTAVALRSLLGAAGTEDIWYARPGSRQRKSRGLRGIGQPATAHSLGSPLFRRSLLLAPEALEGEVGRLLAVVDRQQTGLPAAEVRLVLEQEPQHHVDPRVPLRDRERLRQVRRLGDRRYAEDDRKSVV